MKAIKKELDIFRGTYEEVLAEPTKDMTIYLSWDTQEIFIGNKFGVKTPYNGGKDKLSEREFTLLFRKLTKSELSVLKAQISTITERLTELDTLDDQMNEFLNSIDETVEEALDRLTGPNGAFNDLIYKKTEFEADISAKLLDYYTKVEVDAKFPDGLDLPFKEDYIQLKGIITALKEADSTFDSIAVLGNDSIPTDDVHLVDELALVTDGVYRYRSERGYEIIIKNGVSIIRIGVDGHTYKLSGTTWLPLFIDPFMITSINGLQPEKNTGMITLTADNIDNSSTRKWNALLPDENGALNPDGRNTSYPLGSNSISFGNQSGASGENSIAIGAHAVSTGINAIQLGSGNSTDNKFSVWNYTLMDKDTGKIPTSRIIERFYEEVIDLDFSSNTVVVHLPGMTTSAIVWVSPAESTFEDYVINGIRATAQSIDQLTFTCEKIPSRIIKANVVWRV